MRSIRSAYTLLSLLLAVPLPAQQGFLREERALNRIAANKLAGFGRLATRNRMHARAAEAYRLITRDYDPKHPQALRGLGFKKVNGEWQEPDRPDRWSDDLHGAGYVVVAREWDELADALATMHRTLGLEWYASEAERGRYHLERAISYRHDDVKAHRALGHGVVEGFWGSDAELALVQRMRALQVKAIELSQRSYPVDLVASLPVELMVMTASQPELEFHGARSETFTFFVSGSQQEADECVRWAERAVDFLRYCLPRSFGPREEIRRIHKRRWVWQAFLSSRAELRSFFRLNPQVEGRDLFGKIRWNNRGQASAVTVAMTSAERREDVITGIWKSPFRGASEPFLEGIAHAATIFLGATASTRSSAPGMTTSTGLAVVPADSGSWWQRQMREQARFAADVPLLMLPDIKLGKIRSDARLKAWSFMTWTMARLPRRWHEFLQRIPTGIFTKREDFPNLVQAHFRIPLPELEWEWRAWASGRSTTAQATGQGRVASLVPSAASELTALHRLNRLRALAGLGPCVIDPELSLACRDHAGYLEHSADRRTWPQRQTEDLAAAKFTPRGLRAAQNATITVKAAGSGGLCIDRWIGSIYARLRLLGADVRRIGLAISGDIAVLDSASLCDPRSGDRELRHRIVLWPPDGVVGVPTSLHAADESSALAVLGADLHRAGYPASLQMSRSLARELEAGSISIHECRRAGKDCRPGPELQAWIHLPGRPLLDGSGDRSVLFAIPKRQLQPATSYLVKVRLVHADETEEISWHFTTGRRARGHADMGR